MSATLTYGSLDDLVSATLADFARCGIDCLTKLALLEAAWNHTVPLETPAGYALCLGCSDTPDSLRTHLEQLASCGLLVREGDCYHITDSPAFGITLNRLQTFWSDRELHARAAPLLRYRIA